jgi:hypothetical protein
MRQKLTPPADQVTFQEVATPSGPHSQHPWRCRKYDATPSLCLSLHGWHLEDLPAERPRPTTDGLSEVRHLGLVTAREPPHLRALSATLGSVPCGNSSQRAPDSHSVIALRPQHPQRQLGPHTHSSLNRKYRAASLLPLPVGLPRMPSTSVDAVILFHHQDHVSTE